MRTIVFSNLKGGVGKTMHTAHLAVALEALGEGPVAIMDLDPQGTLSDWWNDRKSETPAFAQVNTQVDLPLRHAELGKAGYAWLIIDTPPQVSEMNRAAIKLADLVIIPSKHSKGDIKASLPTVDLCEVENTKFIYLLNETNGVAVANSAVKKLAEFGPVIPQTIPKLNGYWQAMSAGMTINEITKGTGAILIDELAAFVVARFERKKSPEKVRV
jgi:chromosome partitioning protein